MTKVLVTGGTGELGRGVVSILTRDGYTARIMSHRPQPDHLEADTEWAQADLASGQGIAEAVAGIDVIVHAASNPLKPQRVDVPGTRMLLDHARAAGVRHIVYISIVGIERIPYYYYQAKLSVEEMIENAGMPWSILRATQFHELIGLGLGALTKPPLLTFLPTDLQFQPIAASEVSRRLSEIVEAGPGGRLPDIGGPEVLTAGELAKIWLALRRMRRMVIPVHLPGKVAQGYRDGYNTCPEHKYGKITWPEWVRQKYRNQGQGMQHTAPEAVSVGNKR